jgi:hypothetical protein
MNEECCKQWLMNANVVNNDWWMRKWVVNKTKMRRWIILDLKDCFFFSFLLKHFLLFIHLFLFQAIFKNFFEAFHHVVCVKIFFFFKHHQTRSFSFEYAEDRFRQEKKFKMLSTLFQIFDDEICFQMRFWCWSIDLQSLCDFKCCLSRRTFVVNLSIAFSWLINLRLIRFFMLRRIKFSFKRSSWLISSRRMFDARFEFEKFSFWKNSWNNEKKNDSRRRKIFSQCENSFFVSLISSRFSRTLRDES